MWMREKIHSRVLHISSSLSFKKFYYSDAVKLSGWEAIPSFKPTSKVWFFNIDFSEVSWHIVRCTRFKYTVQWVLTNAYFHWSITASTTQDIFTNPNSSLTPTCGQLPQHPGPGRLCQSSWVPPFLEFQRQASFVQCDVFEDLLYRDVRLWLVSFCGWVGMPLPSLSLCW